MLVGGVVENHVHQNLDAALTCLGEQAAHILQRAEHGLDVLIVGDVVAVVVLRGLEHRGEPDGVHA